VTLTHESRDSITLARWTAQARRERLDEEADAIMDHFGIRLTPMQVDVVLPGMYRGLTNAQIATEVGVMRSTVASHVHWIIQALRARSRGEACYRAQILGLVGMGRRGEALAALRVSLASTK
jgi:DNA-binding NarL/FixJ family response regulator